MSAQVANQQAVVHLWVDTGPKGKVGRCGTLVGRHKTIIPYTIFLDDVTCLNCLRFLAAETRKEAALCEERLEAIERRIDRRRMTDALDEWERVNATATESEVSL